MKTLLSINKKNSCHTARQILIALLFFGATSFTGISQCPPNIDFENGTFSDWRCHSGVVTVFNAHNLISLDPLPGPVNDSHTMFSAMVDNGPDEFGGFPKSCPNGSGHSIQLGNKRVGNAAVGLSYDFVVPVTANKFNLSYNYAVVFEGPGHLREEQSRVEVEVRDVTDNTRLDCFSFSFISVFSMPGFLQSTVRQDDDIPVWYKDWSTNTILLEGYQGKTIQLFFRAAGCTYSEHFCYAYIDVNALCDDTLNVENFCADDTAVNVRAPAGYQQYKWYDNTFSQVLGTQRVLHLNPLPAAGTIVRVELIPFPGYGCTDTLVTELQDTLMARADAGPDIVSCNLNPVQLGGPPVSRMLYKWKPAFGLDNPDISNPHALPDRDTTYVLTVQSEGGGCLSTDTVKVFVRNIDNSLELTGSPVHCLGFGPDPVLKLMPVNSVQWYKNDQPIAGADQLTYNVRATATYHALLFSDMCFGSVRTRDIDITIDTAMAGIIYPSVDVAFNFPFQLQARRTNLANSVLWTPAINLDDSRSFTPYFRGLTTQLYTIEIKTPSGCITVDTQLVKTYKEIAIYVPSVFTPDGDGNNDHLRPLLLGFEKLQYFRVYNRWGKLLFETRSDLPGWDGKIKNMSQETQTVVWMLDAVDVDGKRHVRKGTSLLLH